MQIVSDVLRGLGAVHDAGLVHRDIKPDNIMVGRDGRVRVMDLGLARALGGDEGPVGGVSADAPTAAGRELAALSAQVTRAGSVLGTPAYMSPEQFRGHAVDVRADVFSFCVMLWEALMGERPFAGDTMIELAANVLTGVVRPVPTDDVAFAGGGLRLPPTDSEGYDPFLAPKKSGAGLWIALGSIVVMTTSTLNRVMVVELALPALVPGLLPDSSVFAYRLRCVVTTLVIEVYAHCTVADLLPFNPKVYEPFAQLTILSAILHLFIIPVYGYNVLFPAGRSVAIPRRFGWRKSVQ